MTGAISIRLQPAKAFTARNELAILHAALRENPGSALIRTRLAKLLNQQDAFDETVALLSAPAFGDLEYEELLALATAHFSRKLPGDIEPALRVTAQAIAKANDDGGRSFALSEHAKAHLHAGNLKKAVDLLCEALVLDPHNRNAFKRLVQHHLENAMPEAVIALTDKLVQQGVCHARLLAMRTLALAASGRTEEARATTDLSTFIHAQMLDHPEGWDLADFNGALSRELLDNPGIRYDRFGTASIDSWRIDAPSTAATPAVQALLAAIRSAVEEYARSVAVVKHKWTSFRPKDALLDIWSVITERDGREQWHMHPKGWLSGGYYAAVPDAVVEGNDEAGCLCFGLPDGLIGADAAEAFGQRVIRPEPGLLTLFPSHFYHRTFAHKSEGKRICVAFDIIPV